MPKRLTTESFVEKAIRVHGRRYDYARVCYVDSRTKVDIGCPKHGRFEQTPAEHLIGKGCRACGHESQRAKKAMTREDWIAKARKVHGDRYDYSKVEYRNNRTNVIIGCPDHGEFHQRPEHHLNGVSCPVCIGKGRGTGERFASTSRVIHGDRYDYSKVEYSDQFSKVEIVCSKHGSFWMIPTNHQQGQNCPKCARRSVKAETELCGFLDQYGVRYERGNRSLIAPYEIDIYLPEFQLGIEYCGLYWHSETTGRDQNYHIAKHIACTNAGVRLITLFEDEWRDQRSKVETTLRHFIGRSEKGIYARKTKIQEIIWAEARPFLDRHHLLGAGRPGTYRIGAFYENQLIAVMTFGAPSDERGASKLIEMKRFVTDGRNHPGLGSRMFEWAVRRYQFDHVLAFVDRRWFTGTFKSIAGFVQTGVTRPSLYWTDHRNRFHRRQFKKIGPDGTKRSQLEQKGLSRIWDCGKVRLEWSLQTYTSSR